MLNEAMGFTVFAFNWPIPEIHGIYNDRKRRVLGVEDLKSLLKLVEDSNLCYGLPQDETTMSIAVDPTSNVDLSAFPQTTVVRHSIPKSVSEDRFQSSVSFRSPNCELLQIGESLPEDPCNPFSKTLSALKKASSRKKKTSSAPAKSKAPLASCSSEKLVATVKATRLGYKQLENRLKELEGTIKDDGVAVSGTIENDILKITSGQNLEATPHMKFFWEQQINLLKSEKFGRQYHPQIIRIALSLHATSPAAYRQITESKALILPSESIERLQKLL